MWLLINNLQKWYETWEKGQATDSVFPVWRHIVRKGDFVQMKLFKVGDLNLKEFGSHFKIMKINLSGNLLEKNLQKSWNYVILKSENPGYYTNVKDYVGNIV